MKLAIAILIASVRISAAQPKSEADGLFREGLALFDAGMFDEACAKFELSILKDPHAIGTLMNLGRCNERRGKVATALKRFQEAYDRASQANAVAMRNAAQERVAALITQAPIVTFHRAAPALAGETLVVDDQVIVELRELRLDPGPHTVVLTAPGRLPYEKTFSLSISSSIVVELPQLERPKSGDTVRIRSSTRRVVGKISVFAGLGISAAAGGLAIYAKRDYDKQFADPDGAGPGVPNCSGLACNKAGHDRTERDRTLETSAAVIGTVGLVAAATGLVLWLTSPAEHRMLVPTASADAVGVSLISRF